MTENKSSLTALISAFSRAYHSLYDTPKIFDDFIVKDLITEKELKEIGENMVNGIPFFNQEIANQFHGQPNKILEWITQVQLSPTPLARAAYCEKVLLHEMVLGVKQYVILGAGLDSFCFRHPELNDRLQIFEIDQPATQEFKKIRLANADYQIPDHLHLIPMDLTKAFTIEELIKKGFKTNEKTFFSLLGVSYYLSKPDQAKLIHSLFTHVPTGSSIVFDYADSGLFKEKGMSNRVQHMVQMAEAGGEPMKSCYELDEIEKMLEKEGLLIYEHLSPDEIQNQFFQNRSDYLSAFETIHYIHAVKN